MNTTTIADVFAWTHIEEEKLAEYTVEKKNLTHYVAHDAYTVLPLQNTVQDTFLIQDDTIHLLQATRIVTSLPLLSFSPLILFPPYIYIDPYWWNGLDS